MVKVRFTDEEFSVLEGEARRAGLGVGAWSGEQLMRIAGGLGPRGVVADWAAVSAIKDAVDAASQLENAFIRVGVNVNQMAKVANTTGELPQAQILEAALGDYRQALREVLPLVVELTDRCLSAIGWRQ